MNEVCEAQEMTISTLITDLEEYTAVVKKLLNIDNDGPIAEELKSEPLPTVIMLRNRLDAIGRDWSMIVGNLQGM